VRGPRRSDRAWGAVGSQRSWPRWHMDQFSLQDLVCRGRDSSKTGHGIGSATTSEVFTLRNVSPVEHEGSSTAGYPFSGGSEETFRPLTTTHANLKRHQKKVPYVVHW
jgi:hypothetical protein